ncbi:DUF2262 domain-containing protein [Streptococcus sp. SO4]|uniref:DUF2262 domain-containing protein n=1 Tax=Streptococcus sp. SO4 TaxID=3018249 RepID=UPI00345EBAA8
MINRLKTPFEKTRNDFEQEFTGEIVELLIFTLQNVNGAISLKDGCKIPSVHFKASVNVETQDFSELEGRLEWLLTPEEFEEKHWGFSFEPYKIHRIKCQKRPFMELEPYMSEVANNCYRLLEYLDDQSTDSRLETLIESYQKPVIIQDAIGEFTLNRAYSWFEGFITYEGVKIHAMFDAGADESLPPSSFDDLKKFMGSFQVQDAKIKDYIVKELWETAQDWIDSDENDVELTEEYFTNSLFLSELSVNEEGQLTLYYDDSEEIFAGHAIEVVINQEGKITGVDLVG